MIRGFVIILWSVLGGIFLTLSAQEPHAQDSLLLNDVPVKADLSRDTVIPVVVKNETIKIDTTLFNKPKFKPNPAKAVLYSAIFPGLGQIYNRKYWKLPIIYGGALGLTYAITWNGRMYNDYNQAFRDLVTGSGDSYKNFLKPNQTPEEYATGREGFQSVLRRQKDFFRQNRDLAIIVAVGVYALCMIDAYVDAQLYDFDMSEDLSMRVAPVVWGPSSYSRVGVGLQCSITF